MFYFAASRVQLPVEGACMPSGDQTVLSQSEVPCGRPHTPVSVTDGQALLPHRDEVAEDSGRAHQTLLCIAGQWQALVTCYVLSYFAKILILFGHSISRVLTNFWSQAVSNFSWLNFEHNLSCWLEKSHLKPCMFTCRATCQSPEWSISKHTIKPLI